MRLWAADCIKHNFVKQYADKQIEFPTDNMILNKLPKQSSKSNKKSKDSFINLLKSQAKKSKDKSMERGVLISHFNVNTILKQEKLNISANKAEQLRQDEERKRDRLNRKRLYKKSYGYQKGKIKCVKGHYMPHQ